MAKINQFKLAFLYHPPSFSPPSPYSLLSASSRYLISLDVETMDILKPDAPAAAASVCKLEGSERGREVKGREGIFVQGRKIEG